jgi:hypothetical protein
MTETKNDKHPHFIQLSEFHTLHRDNSFQTSQINIMQLLLVWTLLHKTTNLFASSNPRNWASNPSKRKRHKFQCTRQFHVQFQDMRRRAQLSSAMESLIIIFADLRTKSHLINLYLKLKMERGSWDHELLCLLLLLLFIRSYINLGTLCP